MKTIETTTPNATVAADSEEIAWPDRYAMQRWFDDGGATLISDGSSRSRRDDRLVLHGASSAKRKQVLNTGKAHQGCVTLPAGQTSGKLFSAPH